MKSSIGNNIRLVVERVNKISLHCDLAEPPVLDGPFLFAVRIVAVQVSIFSQDNDRLIESKVHLCVDRFVIGEKVEVALQSVNVSRPLVFVNQIEGGHTKFLMAISHHHVLNSGQRLVPGPEQLAVQVELDVRTGDCKDRQLVVYCAELDQVRSTCCPWVAFGRAFQLIQVVDTHLITESGQVLEIDHARELLARCDGRQCGILVFSQLAVFRRVSVFVADDFVTCDEDRLKLTAEDALFAAKHLVCCFRGCFCNEHQIVGKRGQFACTDGPELLNGFDRVVLGDLQNGAVFLHHEK
ncbi:hypothetical protein OGAPHI_005087 [Ogataea philodendri]|uniref:Uncharacterized protein n=1 Tax=Ogataea philodendri TaxID=1378263 RepID=A0A9P8P2A4_9ASCO|nr:uncharacterized protein OGAPHI_005087 [Ogataea philodendri]KAH3663686.1 hypothetical protein OGAPHI_005087 [Ogataea philodendri]